MMRHNPTGMIRFMRRVMNPTSGLRMISSGLDADVAADATSAFAAALYRELVRGNRDANTFVSPFSVFNALAIVAAGAGGQTRDEVRTALHVTEPLEDLNALHRGLGSILGRVVPQALGKARPSPVSSAPFSRSTPYQLRIANALWGEQTYPFAKAYLATMKQFYGADVVIPTDFQHAPERARLQINAWAAERTEGRIPNLLGRGHIHTLTRLVVANAVYFKGAWGFPFSKGRPAPFHLSASIDVEVPLMQLTETLPYIENNRFQALTLPYRSLDGDPFGEVSMVVVLPRSIEGLPALEASLTGDLLGRELSQAAFSKQRVRVWLPKLTARNSHDLQSVLQTMGMRQAFIRGAANFSNLSPLAARDELYVSSVVQEAFVNVDEEGTEAAAATAAVLTVGRPLRPAQPPPAFRADHPFFYMIRHNPTGVILFMGRMVNPATAS